MKKLLTFILVAAMIGLPSACMTTRTSMDGTVTVSQIDTDFIESVLDIATSPEVQQTLASILELRASLEEAANAADRVDLREKLQLALDLLNQIAPDLAKNIEEGK